MKILLAISETPPQRSGIARIAARLRDGYEAAGHEVGLLTVEDTGRVVIGETRLTGLAPRWPWLRNRLRGADVVAVHGPVPTFSDALLLLLALRRGGRPRVVYAHQFDIDFPLLAPLSALYNWAHLQLARTADRVVVATPSHAEEVGRAVDPRRVAVVPWGIDPVPAVRAEKAAVFTALFVGQLRPYKSVDTLVRAAADAPEARFVIAGDGPRRAALERLAVRMGATNVEFAGAVDDERLRALYAEAHAVVLPSKSRLEAFGITLVEGMAAGCVPVASGLPGLIDVVGDAGYTFPAGDAKALGRLLSDVAADGDALRLRSERARQRAAGYSWERTVRGYLDVFDAALGAPATERGATPADARGRP